MIYYTPDFSGRKDESRRLLGEAIAEYTGDSGRAEKLLGSMHTGKNGKPYIDGFDFFSISHTGGVWAVLFSGSECGLDIQLPRESRAVSIAERFYHPEDAAAVAAAHDEDPQKERYCFFRLWTRREALVKALGGSVADSGMPPVMKDRAVCCGETYTVLDIRMPDMPEIFAAVCIKGDEVPEIRMAQLGADGGARVMI